MHMQAGRLQKSLRSHLLHAILSLCSLCKYRRYFLLAKAQFALLEHVSKCGPKSTMLS